jgi:hypothetical protein
MFFLFSLSIAIAQDPNLQPDTNNSPSESVEQSITVSITLSNGITLEGTIPFNEMITWQPEGSGTIHFTPANGGMVELPFGNIAMINTAKPQLQQPVEQSAPPPEPIEDPATVVIPKDPEPVEIELTEGGFKYKNPAASRYLYAPSSIGLQKGQGYVSQKLLFTTGVYAINDNVTILAGAFGPLVTVTGVKLSKQLNESLHIGAGAEVFFLPLAGTAGDMDNIPNIPMSIFFGSVTYGNLDQHVTVATGYIYDQIISDSNDTWPIMIAGHKRVADRIAIVSENWILLEPVNFSNNYSPIIAGINSFAFRIIGRRDSAAQIKGSLITNQGYPRSTWDLGLVMVNYSERFSVYDEVSGNDVYSNYRTHRILGPMPWIDYTWHFGPARK